MAKWNKNESLAGALGREAGSIVNDVAKELLSICNSGIFQAQPKSQEVQVPTPEIQGSEMVMNVQQPVICKNWKIATMKELPINAIIQGDALEVVRQFPDSCVDCVITSPPYWALRDYGVAGQIGLETTPEQYVERIRSVFAEVRRVLKATGTLWLNLGDTYSAQRWSGSGKGQAMNKHRDGYRDINPERDSSLPDKCLVGIPWRVAFALQSDGWILRQDIIWAKPNPMPESVRDRCTKSHEYLFLLSKNGRYFFDHEAIREPANCKSHKVSMKSRVQGRGKKSASNGHECCEDNDQGVSLRNRRSVWNVPTRRFQGAHFATFPKQLVSTAIQAACPRDGLVLDPFFGAGTTGLVAQLLGRNFVGIELNPAYCEIARKRLEAQQQNSVITISTPKGLYGLDSARLP